MLIIRYGLCRRPVGSTEGDEWETVADFDTEQEAHDEALKRFPTANWHKVDTSWGGTELTAEIDRFEYVVTMTQEKDARTAPNSV